MYFESQLTENERLVFYALAKYSDLNDIKLSSKINIKRSTLTAIKNRLKKEDYYKTFNVPNFELLGCKSIYIIYGQFNPTIPFEKRNHSFITRPEEIFTKITNTEYLKINFITDFNGFQKDLENEIINYEKNDFYENEPALVYFQMEMANFLRFFNFAPLLKELFQLKSNDSSEENERIKKEMKREFTKKEKEVLYVLVKYPNLNNTELSKNTKLSRPTISRIRQRFMKEGFLKTIIVPDFKKLGCELMVVEHLWFNPKNSILQKKKGFDFLKENPSLFFLIVGEREALSLNLYPDYTAYNASSNKNIQFYREKKFLKKDPKTCLIPINNIKFANINFAPLVKSILKIGTDF